MSDPADWDWMRKLRNEAKRLKRKAIREYWNSKAEDLKARPQDFYRTFLSFIGAKKARISDASNLKLRIDGYVTSDKQRVTEEVGSYFSKLLLVWLLMTITKLHHLLKMVSASTAASK